LYSIKSRFSKGRRQGLVFADIGITKFQIGVRFQEALQIPLPFHAGPKGDLVEFVIRNPHDRPTLAFQQAIFQDRVSQRAGGLAQSTRFRVVLGTSEMEGTIEFDGNIEFLGSIAAR